MKLTERINFRQPKYMLPAIVYLPLLGASYFIFDLFDTKVAEKKDHKYKNGCHLTVYSRLFFNNPLAEFIQTSLHSPPS